MRKYVHTKDAIGFEGGGGAWIRFDRVGGDNPRVYVDKSMDTHLTYDQFWEVADWVRGKEPPKPAKKIKKKTAKKRR